jgi:ABC-2 type transport system permease protein
MSETALPGLLVSRAAPRPTSPLGDTRVMIVRCVRMIMRDIDQLLMAILLPVMMMILFVYLFGGAIRTGQPEHYVSYVAPGVLVLCVTWGASQTGVSVGNDMNSGIIDRFRSMDVGGAALLTGHVVASLLKNLGSTALVLAIALAIGFRPHASAAEWAGALGILLAFILAVSWLSAVFGLITKSSAAASNFAFFMMFLPYVSSAFVPIATLPTWLRAVARNQPATPIVGSVRGLLLHQPVGSAWWLALAWCGGILLVSITGSRLLFQRRAS